MIYSAMRDYYTKLYKIVFEIDNNILCFNLLIRSFFVSVITFF